MIKKTKLYFVLIQLCCSVIMAFCEDSGNRTTMSTNVYDTIVVGLGAAGVTALTRLAKAGKHVLGLEASDRIGGRVHTYNVDGGKVELGAEWIHGTDPSKVYDVALTENITLVEQNLDFVVYRSEGSVGDGPLFNELLTYCVWLIENPPQEPEPLGQFVVREFHEYIQKNKPDLLKDEDFIKEFLIFMNLVTNNYESSNDWNEVTTSSRYEELGGPQHVSWHRYGYSTLFDIFLNTYNNGPGLPNLTTKLSSPVRSISYNQSGVKVACDDVQYTAKSVIVTVSLAVLKHEHKTLFAQPLPKKKVDAIENMSMGVMDKIILFFDEAWWPKESNFFSFIWRGEDKKLLPKEDVWITRIFGASRPMGCSTALTLWTSGEVAKTVEVMPEDVVKRKSMQLLRMFMGKGITIPEPTSITRSKWYSNPFTRGSYTFDNVASAYHPEWRSDLREPVRDANGSPRILFAGEATNDLHFSTVHGAMETGFREADRLLELKSKL